MYICIISSIFLPNPDPYPHPADPIFRCFFLSFFLFFFFCDREFWVAPHLSKVVIPCTPSTQEKEANFINVCTVHSYVTHTQFDNYELDLSSKNTVCIRTSLRNSSAQVSQCHLAFEQFTSISVDKIPNVSVRRSLGYPYARWLISELAEPYRVHTYISALKVNEIRLSYGYVCTVYLLRIYG